MRAYPLTKKEGKKPPRAAGPTKPGGGCPRPGSLTSRRDETNFRRRGEENGTKWTAGAGYAIANPIRYDKTLMFFRFSYITGRSNQIFIHIYIHICAYTSSKSIRTRVLVETGRASPAPSRAQTIQNKSAFERT